MKDERVLALRMSLGRAFQREGAAAAKALSPQDRRLVLMGWRRWTSADLRQRETIDLLLMSCSDARFCLIVCFFTGINKKADPNLVGLILTWTIEGRTRRNGHLS